MRRRRMAGGERFDATAGDREAWTPDDHEENAAFRNKSRVRRIGCGGGEGGAGESGRPKAEGALKEAEVICWLILR